MSPEQVEGEEADARSDIFAFGLFELVTGKRVFDSPSPTRVMTTPGGRPRVKARPNRPASRFS
jgi:hypothetical protein